VIIPCRNAHRLPIFSKVHRLEAAHIASLVSTVLLVAISELPEHISTPALYGLIV
jgi:hypothetical protein